MLRWSVLKRYYIISGTLSLGYGSIHALLADLRDTFGFADSQLGVIAGAGSFAGFLAQANRGCRRLGGGVGV